MAQVQERNLISKSSDTVDKQLDKRTGDQLSTKTKLHDHEMPTYNSFTQENVFKN